MDVKCLVANICKKSLPAKQVNVNDLLLWIFCDKKENLRKEYLHKHILLMFILYNVTLLTLYKVRYSKSLI